MICQYSVADPGFPRQGRQPIISFITLVCIIPVASRISQIGCQSPRKDANLLFDQFFPKTAWNGNILCQSGGGARGMCPPPQICQWYLIQFTFECPRHILGQAIRMISMSPNRCRLRLRLRLTSASIQSERYDDASDIRLIVTRPRVTVLLSPACVVGRKVCLYMCVSIYGGYPCQACGPWSFQEGTPFGPLVPGLFSWGFNPFRFLVPSSFWGMQYLI